jgi:transposase-like protein
MMTNKEKSDIARKLRILNHAVESGNVSKTCRYFGISRECFYKWKRDYEKQGESPRINQRNILLKEMYLLFP